MYNEVYNNIMAVILMIKKQFENHAIISSILTSLIASVIYSLFIEPILKEFQTLKSLEITITFPFPVETPFLFSVNVITFAFFFAILWFLIISVSIAFFRKRITKRFKNNLPNDEFCEGCEKISTLTKECHKHQKKYKELLSKYNEELPYKKLTDQLNLFFDQNEVLESLQLFTVSELPTLEQANSLEKIHISLRFVHGMAKDHSNTNALFNINYIFEKRIYHDIKKLFDTRNGYYLNNNHQRDLQTESDIQREAIRVYNLLKNELNNIVDIKNVKETHYACYKLLEIVAHVVIGNNSIVQYEHLLNSPEVEEQLKFGQRNGMLGAIFTENLYCFYNENSRTKKDRVYFSVPISYKQNQLILLGICNKNNLRVSNNNDHFKCCEQIYDGIKKSLEELRGEVI